MPRANLTIKKKEQLIKDKENGSSNVELIDKYKIGRSSVFRCLTNIETIREATQCGLGKRRRLEKKTEIREHDELTKAFILKCQDQGIPISSMLIREKAKELAIQIGREDLDCSWGWFNRFKERVNLKFGKLHGEKNSVNSERVKTWKEITIPRLMFDWQKPFIFNCDETGLFWRQTPVKSYFISKTEHSGDKLFHERVSILFAVNRDGDKLPPLVIGKSIKPRCFYSNCLDGMCLNYINQTNAWMDLEVFNIWLEDLHRQLEEENKKILLILDNFKGHLVKTNKYPLITFQFLPPSSTCLTQPLDGGIIRSFKSKYLSLFIKKIITDIEDEHISQLVKKITLINAMQWIDQAWKSVTKETVVNCWSHFGYNDNHLAPESQLNELQKALSDLNLSNNVKSNLCSAEELITQVTFDYVNYFDD